MNCKEFQHWLTTRDIHEAVLSGEAVAHMRDCSSCERLFHYDTSLEDTIRKGMEKQELPRGLAERISASLDHQTPSKKSLAAKIATASLALLLLVIASYFSSSEQPGRQFEDPNQIGTHAVRGHLAGNRHTDFTAAQTDQALAMMSKTLGFKVLLPDSALLGCTLVGGRLCVIGDCKAAYFVLDRKGKPGSLYIMDTLFLSFNMAEGNHFNTRIQGCQADIWKEKGQIYAMVF